MNARPFPVVLSAPSGAGKTSLARALVERNAGVVFSISATTRPPRLHERPGVDYYFVADAEFDRMATEGELVESAWVHGRRYGTPRRGIEQGLALGKLVVLDIDVQGARQIRAAFPESVLIFILPPNTDEWIRRLTERASEDARERRERLHTARVELGSTAEFDYLLVNDDFKRAIDTLETILRAERHRMQRAIGVAERLDELNSSLDQILGGSRV